MQRVSYWDIVEDSGLHIITLWGPTIGNFENINLEIPDLPSPKGSKTRVHGGGVANIYIYICRVLKTMVGVQQVGGWSLKMGRHVLRLFVACRQTLPSISLTALTSEPIVGMHPVCEQGSAGSYAWSFVRATNTLCFCSAQSRPSWMVLFVPLHTCVAVIGHRHDFPIFCLCTCELRWCYFTRMALLRPECRLRFCAQIQLTQQQIDT